MNAALRLSWYKFKHHYMDFVKVLLGIVAFEGLILYIQDKGFLKDFETTRMTLFLLLFSTSLLIVVQNSIYISKERSVLNRDFFSGLSRSAFALASMGIHAFFAVFETIVFPFLEKHSSSDFISKKSYRLIERAALIPLNPCQTSLSSLDSFFAFFIKADTLLEESFSDLLWF